MKRKLRKNVLRNNTVQCSNYLKDLSDAESSLRMARSYLVPRLGTIGKSVRSRSTLGTVALLAIASPGLFLKRLPTYTLEGVLNGLRAIYSLDGSKRKRTVARTAYRALPKPEDYIPHNFKVQTVPRNRWY